MSHGQCPDIMLLFTPTVWRVLETWQNKKHLAKCKLMSAARSADIYPFSKQIFSFYSHKSHEIYYACTNITVRSIIIARDVPFYTVILLIIFLPNGGCMKTYSVWKHTVMTVVFLAYLYTNQTKSWLHDCNFDPKNAPTIPTCSWGLEIY